MCLFICFIEQFLIVLSSVVHVNLTAHSAPLFSSLSLPLFHTHNNTHLKKTPAGVETSSAHTVATQLNTYTNVSASTFRSTHPRS